MSLKTEVDAETRARVLERDGGHCRWCGTSTDVQVHHVLYRSELGPGRDRNLICLCAAHHAAVHADKRKYQPILQRLLYLYYEEGKSLTVLQVQRWR